MMHLAYGRHRQRGTQLLLNTFLVSRNQRLERNSLAALEFMGFLDALDEAVVDKDLDLAIQPFEIYRREALEVEKGLAVVRTIYSTVIYGELGTSKFEYQGSTGREVSIEFNLVSTSFKTEEFLDTNDYDRALDGGMRCYARTSKKKFELRFTLIPMALKEQFRIMKASGTEITFYRDKDADATMACFWTNDFNFYEDRPGYWTGSIMLHEA